MSKPANFDGISRAYRWMEYLSFGNTLQRCRTHYLPELSDRRYALVLGDGDGRFTARLVEAHRQVDVVAVDTSEAMLRLLRKRVEAVGGGDSRRLRVVRTDAMEYVPSSDTDLVVANFFFDCFAQTELDVLVLRVAKEVQPSALWLVSDFEIPAGAMHWPARALIRALYFAFRRLTGLRTSRLPDVQAACEGAGLRRIARQRSLGGVLATELWQRPNV